MRKENRKWSDSMPKSMQKGKTGFILSMITLPIIGFIIFYVAININSILMAFKTFEGYQDGAAVYKWSFDNFLRMPKSFSNPSETGLLHAFRNTMMFFGLEVIIMIPLTFINSYFLYKQIKGYKIFRILFYLPNILTTMIMVVAFKNIIAVDGPISTFIFQKTGAPLPSFLSDSRTAIYFILIYCFWAGLGSNLILFQGGMYRIPKEILEAAELDGANGRQEFFHVIIPLMWNTLSTVIILKFSTIFVVSGPILLFTNGAYDTYTISYWIFSQVYNSSSDFTYAAALGVVLTLINAPIVFGVRYVCNRIYKGVTY